MLQFVRASVPRVAGRPFHSARASLLPAAASAAAHSAAASAPLSAAAVLAEEAKRDVVFPVSAARQAKLAAAAAKAHAHANPPQKKVRIAMPRYMQERAVQPVPAKAAVPSRRVLEGGKTQVRWQVTRLPTGLLPVTLVQPTLHENSKKVLRLQNVTGDSFMAELQLVVGPLFYVKVNSVRTVIHVHSSPKSVVDETTLSKVKQWMQDIGV